MVRRPGRTRRRGISEAEACVRCVHMTVWGDHSIDRHGSVESGATGERRRDRNRARLSNCTLQTVIFKASAVWRQPTPTTEDRH